MFRSATGYLKYQLVHQGERSGLRLYLNHLPLLTHAVLSDGFYIFDKCSLSPILPSKKLRKVELNEGL